MKRVNLIFYLVAVVVLVGCKKDTDPNALTEKAQISVDRFVGNYYIDEMIWDGPEADVDMDGIPDSPFQVDQVFFFDIEDYASVRSLKGLNEYSFIVFCFPVSNLDDSNAGRTYSPGFPQMRMWLCDATYTVDSEGVISFDCGDIDFYGQYLRNFVFSLTGDGFTLTADSHLWDFISNTEVTGKLVVRYKKKSDD